MANTISIPKAHLIMGLCLPLAVMLGYLLAEPLDSATLGVVIFILVILAVPILMKWHHPLFVFSWNAWFILFFLPGSPHLWMVMAFVSLLFGLLSRSVSQDSRFIFVPSILKPVILILMVVLATAFMTGGLGFRSLGADRYGGRAYFYVFAAIAGFFAFTSQRIPAERAPLYIAMFFLASFTSIIGTVAGHFGSKLFFIQAIFGLEDSGPTDSSPLDAINVHFGSLGFLGQGLFAFLLARYGLRGVLTFSKPIRVILFLLAFTACLAGGFRTTLVMMAITVAFLFFIEGLHRTQYLFFFLMVTLTAGMLLVPFARSLPPSMQRSISFLPFDIDPVVKETATSSTDWRIEVWKLVAPEIPKYLIKGKGYGVSPSDLYMSGFGSNIVGTAIAGDYHSGPLTLIIPFGIFGVIAFGWFLVASFRYMIYHYRFGDPRLKQINVFLLVSLAVKTLMYLFVFGNFYTDLQAFLGFIGFSISLNGQASLQVKEEAATELLEPLANS